MFSVRNRILLFSIMVTLVPSFGMGWIFYDMTYRAMAGQTEQKLMGFSASVERQINLWFKERDHDLHVFASSFVLIDNLFLYLAWDGNENRKKDNQTRSSLKKIVTYLNLVRSKFNDYSVLSVIDGEGKVIAASGDAGEALALPVDWKSQIEASKFFIGEVFFRADENSPLVVIGMPLHSDHEQRLGIFVAEIRLWALMSYLKTALSNEDAGATEILLVQKNGRPILSTAWPEGHREMTPISGQEMGLFQNPHHLMDFVRGKRVVGLAAAFRDLPWGLVITEDYQHVFAGVLQARDRIILIAILFSLIIGLGASIVVGQIILPLQTLTQGVLQVANGELDVSLDNRRNDEFGLVTGMFNEMVKQLRQNRQELERLATTDPLTKLANRKQIMMSLNNHIEYFRRYATEFSLLMIDIDFFKKINDTYGHLVGDATLVQMAEIFRGAMRGIDLAGRYGGEEFLVILGQTDTRKAVLIAERIRQAVEEHLFVCDNLELHITISLGVAGISREDDTDNGLIDRADNALYEAKSSGRNRVVLHSDAPIKLLTTDRSFPEQP